MSDEIINSKTVSINQTIVFVKNDIIMLLTSIVGAMVLGPLLYAYMIIILLLSYLGIENSNYLSFSAFISGLYLFIFLGILLSFDIFKANIKQFIKRKHFKDLNTELEIIYYTKEKNNIFTEILDGKTKLTKATLNYHILFICWLYLILSFMIIPIIITEIQFGGFIALVFICFLISLLHFVINLLEKEQYILFGKYYYRYKAYLGI